VRFGVRWTLCRIWWVRAPPRLGASVTGDGLRECVVCPKLLCQVGNKRFVQNWPIYLEQTCLLSVRLTRGAVHQKVTNRRVIDVAIEFADVAKVAAGALLALGTKWVDEVRARRRRRFSIATALLHELRAIEADVRRLTNHSQAGRRGGTMAVGILRRVTTTDDLFLFRSATISAILAHDGLLRDIEEAIDDYRASNGSEDWLHGTVRAKSFFAADGITGLKEALVREGGELPTVIQLETVDPDDLPALGPPAFSEWAAIHDRPGGKKP
jgi:hypothetical protein